MIGENLKKLRKQNNLSQTEAAKIFGISQTTYSDYERNLHEPPYKTLVKIADYFNTSTDFLLGRYEK